MAKTAKTDKPATAAPAAKEAPKKVAAPKGVKVGSDITRLRKSRNLTLSALQKNINLERDIDGRHTETSRKLYRQYRDQGLLGPLSA